MKAGPGCVNSRGPFDNRKVSFVSTTNSISPERWLPVPGYEGLYEVSDEGRVRSSRRRGNLLSPKVTDRGHLTVTLSRGGMRSIRRVHRMVLEAFVGPCPDGLEGCHGNGVPNDNRLANLRWDTRSNNSLDAVMHGVHPQSRKHECKKGHPYSLENTKWEGRRRQCRTCARDSSRVRMAKKRATERLFRQKVIPIGWLIAALAVIVGAGLGYSPVAQASPTDVDAYAQDNAYVVCEVLDTYPSMGGIKGVSQAIVGKGLTAYESGEVIAISIINYCPRHTALMNQFIRRYAPQTTVASGNFTPARYSNSRNAHSAPAEA